MIRHYCVILRQFVVSTLPSYTSISNLNCKLYCQQLHLTYCVTWQGTDCELSEDDTVVSKHVAV
jgi:hypothetical protein